MWRHLATASTLLLCSLALQAAEQAPAFELPSVYPSAANVTLDAHQGKVRYLDFWSAWCQPCRKALPELARLQERLDDDAFQVITVNLDRVPEDARQLLADVPRRFPVAMDPGAQVASQYAVTQLPHAVLVDHTGRIRNTYRGDSYGDTDRLMQDIRTLIKEQQTRRHSRIRRAARAQPLSFAGTRRKLQAGGED